MFVYQVIFPSFLLLVFDLIINFQTPVAGQTTVSCSPPYVQLNSICVISAPPTFFNASPQPCLNQAVTPYPPVPAQPQPCPNQPVTPYPPVPAQPQPCPNQPVTPYPPVLAQPQPCPNQPVTPYPPVPAQPQPCPNQPVTPYPPVPAQPQPCPNQPLPPYPPVPAQPQPCQTQPVTPYPSVPAQPQPCPNLPVAPLPVGPAQPQPCNPNLPVTPHSPVIPQPTPPPYQTIPTIPSTTTSTTTTTTTTTRKPITVPPPATLRRCPKGTVLINDECRLLYCSRGVYDSDRCVEIRCPKHSYWTGEKCVYPQPAETANIHLNKTIINKKSSETPDLVLNNIQNLVVNASLSIPTDYRDYEENSPEMDEEIPLTPSLPTPRLATKCCTVVAPRICRCPTEGRHWQCFNPKERVCGDICSTPKVALSASRITSWSDNNIHMLSMPPNWNSECQRLGNCPHVADRYDCSGCALREMSACSPYCYNSQCNSPRCSYYDQQQFCDLPQSADSVACRTEYGWRR